MIVKLQKLLFIGIKRDLGDFLMRSQEEGFIEFITPRGKVGRHFPPEIQRIIDAIKILRKQPLKTSYQGPGDLAYADEVAEQVLQLKNALEKHEEEKRFLEVEIARVAPFGNFSFKDIDFIEKNGHRKIQFFCVKTSKRQEVVGDQEELLYVGTDYDLDYFIAINHQARSYPGMIEMHFDRSVGELKTHLAFVEETLHQIQAELKGFAGHIDFLRDQLLERLDIHALVTAKKSVSYPLDEAVFSIEAWVPQNQISKIPALIGESAIHFEQILIENSDRIPTLMENKGTSRIGEDLVRLYDIPAATDIDPSPWVFWSFVLFFSIIVADGGYGLIFLLIAYFLKKKLTPMKEGHKRLVKLIFSLSIGCIVWGIFTTSFFGLSVSPNSWIGRYSPIYKLAEKKADYHLSQRDAVYKDWAKQYPQISNVKSGREWLEKAKSEGRYETLDEFTDNILLEIAILVGVIHICLSLLRYVGRNLANIGWVAFAVGGYLYFPISLEATSLVHFLGIFTPQAAAAIGLQMIYFGIGSAVVIALLQKRLRGTGEILHVVHVFSDILSYLRLYALALAATIMAHTFNEMGSEIHFLIGALIILVGHVINIAIGIQSGVIHGLRLNFIEWYHYCFEGDGRLFHPLKRLKKMLQE